jgi:hypothetical protein
MTSIDSAENQKISVDLARGDISNLKSSVYKIAARYTQEERTTLDEWIMAEGSNNEYNICEKMKEDHLTEHYAMPRRLDWNVFRKVYDI